jgi:tetratricopeptide (TPR) repeat protein
MKKLFLIFLGGVLSINLYGQNILENLVKIGIEFHDQGEYENAIEVYQKALVLDPYSALAHYEIAMTYMYIGDYDGCIRHSDQVIALNGEFMLPAYVVKGSCLDYLGQPDQSISLFKQGLKKFGDHYLLYYNLGHDYYKLNELKKAEEAFANAILTNPNHASSHLLMGFLMNDLHNKAQSLMSLYYFLMLEPGSERARQAYELLQNLYRSRVERDQEDPDQINIFIDPDIDSEFGPVDMMVSMLEASRISEPIESKTEEEIFLENTRSFFTVLGELKKKRNRGFWWDFYIPFFYELANSEYLQTYCHYISQASSEFSKDWVEDHQEALKQFNTWIRGYPKNL